MADRDSPPRRVAILHQRVDEGASPDEADVMDQVAAVETALRELGHHAFRVACDGDLDALDREIVALEAEMAFNLVESLEGDGARIAEVPRRLEALGIPFTGAAAESLHVTSSKLLTKRALTAAGLPTPARYPEGDGRYIVKSAWEHASIGLDEGSVVAREAVEATIAEREARCGGRFFAERFVPGRELSLALLDAPLEVLPAAEIDFSGFPDHRARIVSYAAKWEPSSFDYRHTPARPVSGDRALIERLEELSLAAWRCFDLAGYARVDFRVDEGGEPFILEVNANPCLSPGAGFATALGRAGRSPRDAIARILRRATERATPCS